MIIKLPRERTAQPGTQYHFRQVSPFTTHNSQHTIHYSPFTIHHSPPGFLQRLVSSSILPVRGNKQYSLVLGLFNHN
ncbi:MAG: hypothetical protein ACXVKK_14155 [Flavisolibacter sp.]